MSVIGAALGMAKRLNLPEDSLITHNPKWDNYAAFTWQKIHMTDGQWIKMTMGVSMLSMSTEFNPSTRIIMTEQTIGLTLFKQIISSLTQNNDFI